VSPNAYRSVILKPSELLERRWLPLMADAGLNTLMLHAARLPEEIDALLIYVESDDGRRVFEDAGARGLSIEYEMHTASWLLPRELFHGDPSLFRMTVAGERTPQSNFCFSSERAWEIAAERARELVTRLPSQTGRYLLYPDDTAQGVCHCPLCASLSAGDQALIYAERLQEIIPGVHAGAQVAYLAYLSTLSQPPTLHAPADGVFLEYAPIRRCYRHALDDPACAVNRDHVAALDRLVHYFAGHSLHATEYWLDASRHSGWRRPARRLAVADDVVRRDVSFYARRGFDSIATYAVMCGREYWETYGPPPVTAYGAALQAAGQRE